MPDVVLTPAIMDTLRDIAAQRDALAERLGDADVLSDHRKVRELSIKKAALDPVADAYARSISLDVQIDEARALIDSGGDGDAEMLELARDELASAQAERETSLSRALESLVNADDNAIGSVMLEIRAGVGGDEAGLWARDILEMYQRFASARGWKLEEVEMHSDEGMGGVRSCVCSVSGEGVWTAMAHEAGTHCVKRVPATESQGRVHTSTATVAVLPEPEAVELELDPADVDEHVTTAQGPGGQNVNKVATAVHLIHRPTGVEVRMQETKSQAQNREKAWRLLRARLYERQLAEKRAAEAEARSAQIGAGGRAERIRTYRYKDGIAVDHRLGESFALQGVLAGGLDELVRALQAHETARRLESL
ncbi:MAG: PCRF domain-containing protein [Planctomycetota bacterium]